MGFRSHPKSFVDGNGAYNAEQALRPAERFAAEGVTLFEERPNAADAEQFRLQ